MSRSGLSIHSVRDRKQASRGAARGQVRNTIAKGCYDAQVVNAIHKARHGVDNDSFTQKDRSRNVRRKMRNEKAYRARRDVKHAPTFSLQ